MVIKKYKEELDAALEKILILKRKNRKMNEELKALQKEYLKLQEEHSRLESKYESACDELCGDYN
jgi:predicted nuclease with TOPRIM domain